MVEGTNDARGSVEQKWPDPPHREKLRPSAVRRSFDCEERRCRVSFAKCIGGVLFAMLVPLTSSAQSVMTAQAASDESAGAAPATTSDETSGRREPPIAAFAYAAQGSAAKSIGVQAYGLGLVAPGQDRVLGAGGA